MTRRRFFSRAMVAGSLALISSGALAAPRKPSVPTAWSAATPMPLGDAAIGYAHAQCDTHPNSFYVISGANERLAFTTNAWRYDADTDTWNALAPIPHLHGREGLAAVCHQGFIYVAGGAGYAVDASNQLFIYDVANDTWSAGADIPRNVWGAAMGAFGGQVYLMGGDADYFWPGGTSNEVDIYDIATNTWTNTGAPMPVAAHQPGWAQVGQYVYVVGGYADTSPASNVNVTQRYDMSANTWTIGPTFTSARASAPTWSRAARCGRWTAWAPSPYSTASTSTVRRNPAPPAGPRRPWS